MACAAQWPALPSSFGFRWSAHPSGERPSLLTVVSSKCPGSCRSTCLGGRSSVSWCLRWRCPRLLPRRRMITNPVRDQRPPHCGRPTTGPRRAGLDRRDGGTAPGAVGLRGGKPAADPTRGPPAFLSRLRFLGWGGTAGWGRRRVGSPPRARRPRVRPSPPPRTRRRQVPRPISDNRDAGRSGSHPLRVRSCPPCPIGAPPLGRARSAGTMVGRGPESVSPVRTAAPQGGAPA